MNGTADSAWMSWAGLLLVGIGILVGVYVLVTSSDTPVHAVWQQYVAQLEKQTRLLYSRTTGEQIAKRQAIAIGSLLVACILTRELLLIAGAAAVALLPRLYLAGRITERRKEIDSQLDGFLTTLSNALKASPSLGDAMASTANLMRAPIKEDLEFVLKENKLGTPLDQALINMSARIESRSFNTALTTILIGRQTGGELPKILEKSAATLREMARLEGVVRSRTAEGKSQAYVLAAVPFFIVVAINLIDPAWMAPLTSNFIGYVIMGIAATMWVAALFAARRILNVDV